MSASSSPSQQLCAVVYVVGIRATVSKLIATRFREAGFEPEVRDSLKADGSEIPDREATAFVIDRHLGGVPNGGLVACSELRHWRKSSVIGLRGEVFEEFDRLLAYEAGADVVFSGHATSDYVVSRVTQLHRHKLSLNLNQTDLERVRRLRAQLTARERTVFSRLLKGRPNKVIAYELSVSEGAIKAHASSIYRKFEVSSRAELLATLGVTSVAMMDRLA